MSLISKKDFKAFPKVDQSNDNDFYSFDDQFDSIPKATVKQKRYITYLLNKKGLDMVSIYDFAKKDIDEISISEASEFISFIKKF